MPEPSTPVRCSYRCRSWHLAAASYICLLPALLLSFAAGDALYDSRLHLFLSVLFSAVGLLGLTLLVAAAALAIHACWRKPEAVDVAVLLVTLPPIVLHAFAVLLM